MESARAGLPSDYCTPFEEDKATASSWGQIATLLVVIVNQVLKQTIVQTSPALKAHTKEEEMSSKVIRIFMCQLTNTAILLMLSKSTFAFFQGIPGEHYPNVSAKWYLSSRLVNKYRDRVCLSLIRN